MTEYLERHIATKHDLVEVEERLGQRITDVEERLGQRITDLEVGMNKRFDEQAQQIAVIITLLGERVQSTLTP